ncbi:uncharacterized protein ACR2FA_010948 [Aphomia sociella]
MFILKKFTQQSDKTTLEKAQKKPVRENTALRTAIKDGTLSKQALNHSICVEKSSCINFINGSLEKLASSVEEDCFDEIAGRFLSNGDENDDSFQVVFADSPQTKRKWRISECDSEDSFVVFEESPDSCYTSNDLFSDESDSSESESSDSDSEISDSGCVLDEMVHSISKSVGDLTDDSLYVEGPSVDEVDCAARICEEIPSSDIVEVCDFNEQEALSTGVLLNVTKKLLRKSRPPKKVHFSEKPPKVLVMRVWAFAARQARPGHWERYAIDRERFKRRIADADRALSWVLKPQHRCNVMSQRFMPWWNKQKVELMNKAQT